MPAGPSGEGNAEAASGGGGGGGSTGGDEDRGFDFSKAALGLLTGGPFGALAGGFGGMIRDSFGNLVQGTPGPDFGGVGGPGLESEGSGSFPTATGTAPAVAGVAPVGGTALSTSLAGMSPEDIQRLGQQIQFDFLRSVQGEFFPGGPGGEVSTTGFFPGQTFAGLNPQQLQALQQQQQVAQSQAGTPALIQQATEFGLQGVLQPGANPFFQESLQAALRPLTEQFVNQVLPNLGSAAQQAGAFGGSRQGQLEAQITSNFTRDLGEISAMLASEQFNRQLSTFERTQALLPQTQAAQLFPANVLAGVGDVFQQQEQQQISEDVSRFNFGQNIAGARLGEAGQLLNVGGLATSPSAPSAATPETGGLVGALGGASTALGLLGTFNQLTGSTSSSGVAAAAAGLGALFGLFS